MNKSNEISKIAHEADAHYSKMQLKIELIRKFAVAQSQKASGEKGRPLNQVVKSLRKRIRETN